MTYEAQNLCLTKSHTKCTPKLHTVATAHAGCIYFSFSMATAAAATGVFFFHSKLLLLFEPITASTLPVLAAAFEKLELSACIRIKCV